MLASCRPSLRTLRPPAAARGVSSYNATVAGLTPAQDEFRQAVKKFAARELAPRAAEIDKTNKMPLVGFMNGVFPQLGQMGLLGVTVPEERGGLGLGYFEHVVAMEASASVALSYGAHSNLMVNQLNRHGNQQQLDKFLPPLLSGEHIGSLAMSEPDAGSDVVSMRTKAEKVHGGWVLNGSKCWITNAPLSSTFLIYARTSGGPARSALTAFLVERSSPGFSVGDHLDKFGMRGSPTAELFFDNVHIPDENVLGAVGGGAKVLMSGLDLERLVLSGGPLGIMQAALDLTLDYTHDRKQFGQPIASFQLMQGKLADMYTKLSASRAYVYAVARACDAGKVSRQDCAGAILYASDRAVEVAMEAQQCLGGNGYINDYPAGRLLRDARLYTVGAGTQEIRRMLIGREFNVAYEKGDGVVAQ